MPARFSDAPLAMAKAMQIAMNYLERSGEIDDHTETLRFLADKMEAMMRQGQYNQLVLANRAIADFQKYRSARTIEQSLAS
jgi:hypothetical protein